MSLDVSAAAPVMVAGAADGAAAGGAESQNLMLYLQKQAHQAWRNQSC